MMNALQLTLCSLSITGLLTCLGFLAVILACEAYATIQERNQ